STAAKLGLQKDDVIAKVNGKEIFGSEDIYKIAEESPDHPLELTVERAEGDPKAPKITTFPVTLQPSTAKVAVIIKPSWLRRLFGAKADSPAIRAGLQVGDVIVSVDDQPVTTIGKMIKYIGGKDATPVKLAILRGDKNLDLTVTPE